MNAELAKLIQHDWFIAARREQRATMRHELSTADARQPAAPGLRDLRLILRRTKRSRLGASKFRNNLQTSETRKRWYGEGPP
jgi:hypothetical protein